jgi:hypothetical protein
MAVATTDLVVRAGTGAATRLRLEYRFWRAMLDTDDSDQAYDVKRGLRR